MDDENEESVSDMGAGWRNWRVDDPDLESDAQETGGSE